MLGIVGRKAGMTRVFTEDGQSVPVTVIEARPNPIVQIKTQERDGYAAIQVSYGETKASRLSKAHIGQFAKAKVEAQRHLREFRLDDDAAVSAALETISAKPDAPSESPAVEEAEGAAGEAAQETSSADVASTANPDAAGSAASALTVSQFSVGQIVDVSGITIGKGFAGAVKRHNFSMQDATHGNSVSHRAPGSIGQNQTPGRVFKGKKMAGHMGSVRRTQQNLEIVRIDAERNMLLVKGAVPGAAGGNVLIRPGVKAAAK